nr:CDP-glycerol glycerophosphotransferase family protein [Bacillus thuringiensis]
MKVKLLLENMIVKKNNNVEIEISVQTDRNKENICEQVKGLYIHKGNEKEQLVLSDMKIEENKIICILPIMELSKIMNYGKLKVSLLLDRDTILLHVYSNLKKDFFVCLEDSVFQVKKSNLAEKLVEFSRKDHVSVEIIVSNIFKNSEQHFIIEGDFSKEFKRNEVCLKEFFLKNNVTKEIRRLTNLKTNIHANTYQVVLSLKEKPLYEGEWELFCAGTLNGNNFLVNVKNSKNIDGCYFLYNNQVYYHMLSYNNKHELVAHIKKNTKKMGSTKIENIDLQKNTFTIEGMIHFNEIVDSKELVELLFIHRNTKKEQSYPLFIKNNRFKKSILFEECDLSKEVGIWDAFIRFKVQGIKDKIKLNKGYNLNDKADIIIMPKNVLSNSGTIRRARPYVTLDNNLALLIRDEGIYCDITKIDYEGSNLCINGYMNIMDIDYTVKNIYLYEKSSGLKIECKNKFLKKKNGQYFNTVYNLNSFNTINMDGMDLNFMVQIEVDSKIIEFELRSNLDDIRNKSKIMIYPAINNNINGYPIRIQPHYSNQNELYVSVRNSLKAYCKKIDMKKKHIGLVIEPIIQENFVLKDAKIILKNNQRNEEIQHYMQLNADGEYICCINRGLIKSYGNCRWDIYFSASVNGNIVNTRILGADLEIVNKNSTFKSNAVKVERDLYLSVFFDKRSKLMSLETRNLRVNEKASERVKLFVARGVAKTLSKFRKKPVWLIGENLGEVAQDNGFAFFESCINKNVPEDTYYVSKKNNKNMDNLLPYKNKILRYDSFKHLVLYFLSQYLIVSHGIRDVMPTIMHNKMASNNKKVVYLQHGIIAMKKLQFNRDSYNGMIKKFVVSSEHEKNIMINEMNFKEKQVMVTGLVRFDSLVDRSKEKKTREILLMPTWREWIIGSREGFLESAFFVHYYGLLQDKKLHELLEANDLVLKFFPHIEIQKKYKDEFESLNERIKVVKLGEESVKELMQNSSLMITDYSSVVFDFNYMKKPTIFYHFDVNDYLKYRGSYVDLSKDLVGDIAYTKNEVIQYVKKYVENDFTYEMKYSINSKKYYAHNDKNNFNRIYKEIKKINN